MSPDEFQKKREKERDIKKYKRLMHRVKFAREYETFKDIIENQYFDKDIADKIIEKLMTFSQYKYKNTIKQTVLLLTSGCQGYR